MYYSHDFNVFSFERHHSGVHYSHAYSNLIKDNLLLFGCRILYTSNFSVPAFLLLYLSYYLKPRYRYSYLWHFCSTVLPAP